MENWIENCSGVRCQRGRCIELYNTCNGILDCEDGSDETKEMCTKKNNICNRDPFYRGCGKLFFSIIINYNKRWVIVY